VRMYRTAATTIPTAMSAAAMMVSMVVPLTGPAMAGPHSLYLDLRATERPVSEHELTPVREDGHHRSGKPTTRGCLTPFLATVAAVWTLPSSLGFSGYSISEDLLVFFGPLRPFVR
jgi:hypothetical protein